MEEKNYSGIAAVAIFLQIRCDENRYKKRTLHKCCCQQRERERERWICSYIYLFSLSLNPPTDSVPCTRGNNSPQSAVRSCIPLATAVYFFSPLHPSSSSSHLHPIPLRVRFLRFVNNLLGFVVQQKKNESICCCWSLFWCMHYRRIRRR